MRDRLRASSTALLWPSCSHLIMGILTIYSADRGTSQAGLWAKQSLWNLMAFALMAWLAAISKRIFRSAFLLYVLGILSLLVVLAASPRIGGASAGSSWAASPSSPPELMKWLTLLFVAHRLGTRRPQDLTAWDLVGTSRPGAVPHAAGAPEAAGPGHGGGLPAIHWCRSPSLQG